jgi:hypothetical protein
MRIGVDVVAVEVVWPQRNHIVTHGKRGTEQPAPLALISQPSERLQLRTMNLQQLHHFLQSLLQRFPVFLL